LIGENNLTVYKPYRLVSSDLLSHASFNHHFSITVSSYILLTFKLQLQHYK